MSKRDPYESSSFPHRLYYKHFILLLFIRFHYATRITDRFNRLGGRSFFRFRAFFLETVLLCTILFLRVHSTERFIQQVRVNEWIVIEFEYSFFIIWKKLTRRRAYCSRKFVWFEGKFDVLS